MAHPFDITALRDAILGELTTLLDKDVRDYVEFSEMQAKALATQAAWIAEASIKGEIDEDERSYFLDDLKKLSENFARVVVGLTIITLEKAWNAIVGQLWKAINGALESAIGVTIPVPLAPKS